MSGKKGFTLIELLVVIAIVGILSAVAIPMMRGRTRDAMRTEAQAIAGMVRTAERVYYSQYRRYTTSLTDLNIDYVDYAGKYYSSLGIIQPSGTNTFIVNVFGTGDAAGDWVTLNQSGNWTYKP